MKSFKKHFTKLLLLTLAILSVFTVISPVNIYAKETTNVNENDTGTSGSSSSGTNFDADDWQKEKEKEAEKLCDEYRKNNTGYKTEEEIQAACDAYKQQASDNSTTSSFEPVHDRVVIAPLVDKQTNSISIEVVDETDLNTSRVAGSENFGYYDYSMVYGSQEGETQEQKTANVKANQFYLSFPGNKYDYENGVTSQDEALATNVSNILQSSFDDVYGLLKENVSKDKADSLTMRKLATSIYRGVSEDADGKMNGSFSIAGMNVTVSTLDYSQNSDLDEAKDLTKYKVTSGVSKGTTAANYSVFKISGTDEYVVTQVSVPKGYSSGQYAEGNFNDSDTETTNHAYISMRGIACIASSMADKGYYVGETGYKKIYGNDENIITTLFKTLFNTVLKALYATIGLTDIVELVFNRGGRATSYYYGITPTKSMDAAQIFYWICLVIAGFMIFYSIILTAAKRAAADISPSVRVDVKNTILNIIKAVIMLLLFPTIFSLLCKLNITIVEMLSGMISDNATMFDLGVATIGYIIISFVTFGLTVSLNIKYMVRTITVTLCYCIAPIAIASTVMDDRHALFNVWLKELIANIFLQAFNAIVLAFLLMTIDSSRGLFRLVCMYSFIPLNKWFMEDLCGVKNLADRVAQVGDQTFKRNLNNAANSAIDVTAGASRRISEAERTAKLTGGSTNSLVSSATKNTDGSVSSKDVPSASNSLRKKSNDFAEKHGLGLLTTGEKVKLFGAAAVSGMTEMGGFHTGSFTDMAVGRALTNSAVRRIEDANALRNKGYDAFSTRAGIALQDKNGNIIGAAPLTNTDGSANLEAEKLKTKAEEMGMSLIPGVVSDFDSSVLSKDELNAMSTMKMAGRQSGNAFVKNGAGDVSGIFTAEGKEMFDAAGTKKDVSRAYQNQLANGYDGWTQSGKGFLAEDGGSAVVTLPSGTEVASLPTNIAENLQKADLSGFDDKAEDVLGTGLSGEDAKAMQRAMNGDFNWDVYSPKDGSLLRSAEDNKKAFEGKVGWGNIDYAATNLAPENELALKDALNKYDRNPGATYSRGVDGRYIVTTSPDAKLPNAVSLSGDELSNPTGLKRANEEFKSWDTIEKGEHDKLDIANTQIKELTNNIVNFDTKYGEPSVLREYESALERAKADKEGAERGIAHAQEEKVKRIETINTEIYKKNNRGIIENNDVYIPMVEEWRSASEYARVEAQDNPWISDEEMAIIYEKQQRMVDEQNAIQEKKEQERASKQTQSAYVNNNSKKRKNNKNGGGKQ